MASQKYAVMEKKQSWQVGHMRESGCVGRWCCHAVDCIETPSPQAEVRNPKPGHGHDMYISCVSPARIRLRESQGGKSQQNEATYEWMNAATKQYI